MTSTPALSVIVPFYNEEANAATMIDEVVSVFSAHRDDWELICVDDGSSDRTRETLFAAADRHGDVMHVICLRRNFGQTAALQAGIDASRGEIIATLDGDLQNDPADIPRMVEELRARDLDLLAGWRKNRKDGFLPRRLPSLLANRVIAFVTGVQISDYGCGTKVFRGEVLRRIRLFGEMHRFIPVWIASVTSPGRIGETPVNHRARKGGHSKYGLSRTFRVLPDLLAVFFFLRFWSRPGHFFGSIGLVFGALGTLIMGWLLIVRFGFGEDIGDRPLLLVGVLCLVFSIQFLTTGVLAELLARTFFESARAAPYTLAPPRIPERKPDHPETVATSANKSTSSQID